MAIHSGDLVFVDYGEVLQVVHTRLVLAEVDSSINDWVILTPDFDIYTETLAANNPDFVGFHLGLPGGLVPPAIPPGVVYGFAPMTAADLARFMNDGRLEALAERGRRGIANVPVGAPADMWVLASLVEGKKFGEVVVPPPGMARLGEYGMMHVADSSGNNQVALVKRVRPDDVAGLCEGLIDLARGAEACEGDDRVAGEDVRTMSVRKAAIGDRLRPFKESVLEMVSTEMEDFPFEPRTCLEYLRAIQSVSESCHSQHLAWVAQSKVPEGSRAVYEDETLATILHSHYLRCFECGKPCIIWTAGQKASADSSCPQSQCICPVLWRSWLLPREQVPTRRLNSGFFVDRPCVKEVAGRFSYLEGTSQGSWGKSRSSWSAQS